MVDQIATAFRFVRENDLRTIFTRLLERDTHPVFQFIKYGISGVAAAVAHNGTMALLSIFVFPAGKGMIVDGQVLDEVVRNRHLLLNNTLSFPLGLVTAYFLNIAFVFTPGRHSKAVEFLLFALVGAMGFFPGLFVVNWLAGYLHLPSVVAQLGFVFTSVIVNFICRKFFIFKG